MTLTFHLSAHFFENSAKMTFSSGCFFLCSSRHVCTKNAYAVIRPLGFASVPFPLGIFPRFWKTINVHVNIILIMTHKMHTKTLVDVLPTRRTAQYTQNFKYIQHVTANSTLTNAHDSRHSVILNSNLFSFTSGKNLTHLRVNCSSQYVLTIHVGY